LRKLGLIGGMSWASTRAYFEHINRIVQQRMDRRTSAPLLIETLDFSHIHPPRTENDWQLTAEMLADSAKRLEAAGAEALIIGANSMHRVFELVASAVQVPILHIATSVGERLAADGVKLAAVLGTRSVMTESFYRRRLVTHGIDLLPPEASDVELLDRMIYDELMLGRATREAERALKSIIANLEKQGAQAVVLAATELEQVVDVDANVLPIYDSTHTHARTAAEWILGNG